MNNSEYSPFVNVCFCYFDPRAKGEPTAHLLLTLCYLLRALLLALDVPCVLEYHNITSPRMQIARARLSTSDDEE